MFTIVERYHWSMCQIGEMDFGDYLQMVIAAEKMYEIERKANEAAAKGR